MLQAPLTDAPALGERHRRVKPTANLFCRLRIGPRYVSPRCPRRPFRAAGRQRRCLPALRHALGPAVFTQAAPTPPAMSRWHTAPGMNPIVPQQPAPTPTATPPSAPSARSSSLGTGSRCRRGNPSARREAGLGAPILQSHSPTLLERGSSGLWLS